MTSWEAINESTEQLRRCTARMKARRLKLPDPGTLVQVRHLAILAVVDPERAFKAAVAHHHGALLMLVCINFDPPPHPKGELVDPVELIFMSSKGNALVTTGTRAGADVMCPYEVLT